MYIVTMKHNAMADGNVAARATYGEAVDVAHQYFLSYDFELRDGRPFDGGNDDGVTGGFDCFQDVLMHDGKVAGFMHCGGDGPFCNIRKSV